MTKKVTCKVCGTEQEPKKQYVASSAIFPTDYDCMDCSACGCQIVLSERKHRKEIPIGLINTLNKDKEYCNEDDLK